MFFVLVCLQVFLRGRQSVCWLVNCVLCLWLLIVYLCNLGLCVRLQTSAFQYLGWVNVLQDKQTNAFKLAPPSVLLTHPGTVFFQCRSHVPVVFAQEDLICHLCAKDHVRDSKMLLHTAFRIGQRDLWIAGYNPGFIWDRWHSLVTHFEMQLSDWPSLSCPVIDTAAWELTNKMCVCGAVLAAGSWGHHLQHNLGCLEDLIPANLSEVQLQPQCCVWLPLEGLFK